MANQIDNIEQLLKGPGFTKKVNLQLFCGIAKPEDIDTHKKLWSTLEDVAHECSQVPNDTYKEQFPRFFQPEDPSEVSKACQCIDGRDKEVMFVRLLVRDGTAILTKISDFDELRMYARRGTLFLQNFMKQVEKDYEERSKIIRKWAGMNYEDWTKLKSGEIPPPSDDPIYDFCYYLHMNNNFDAPICEIKLENVEIKEESEDGDGNKKEKKDKKPEKVGTEAALGFGGLLGMAGVKLDDAKPSDCFCANEGENDYLKDGAEEVHVDKCGNEDLLVVEVEFDEDDEDYYEAALKAGIVFEATDGLDEEKFKDQAYTFMEKLNKSIGFLDGGELSDEDENDDEKKGETNMETKNPETKDQEDEEQMPGNILDALMETNACYDTVVDANKMSLFETFEVEEQDVSCQLFHMHNSLIDIETDYGNSPLKPVEAIVEEVENPE